MPSASSKRRQQNRKNNEKNRQRDKMGLDAKSDVQILDEKIQETLKKEELTDIEKIKSAAQEKLQAKKLEDATSVEKLRELQAKQNAEHRACTGVLSTQCAVTSNLHIHALSITYHGAVLINDTNLELNSSHRYGIMGPNGCGKSALLAAIGNREVPVPENIDIFYLDHEMPPSDKTPLQSVMEVDNQRNQLEAEVDHLQQTDPESDYLLELYERLDELDASKAEATASRILKGLGFTKEMQAKALADFSGGWRMRVALARALFIRPLLLLLDEPTNHLDLEACVWLEEELKNFNHILMIVSHSQDFLNGVCTDMINIKDQKLEYYNGNYDQYVKTKGEVEMSQQKAYDWEQEQIAHMKNYIARFGHGSAKLAKQAQSKEKTLARMVEKGLTEKVTGEKQITFQFKEVDRLAPPVIQVQDISFQYTPESPWIYRNLEFGLDQDSRLALVGPNGAGKSTLVKLVIGELEPSVGMVRRHNHCKMGHYHQHLAEKLDMSLSPVEFMMKEFPLLKEIDAVRRIIGRYGISGKKQTMPIRNLSEGQKCRVALAWVAQQSPHMLLLDEPTNHLDMESIDALAAAINNYNGGLVLVSHDFRLIGQVAKEIWICEAQKVTPWTKTIQEYKAILKKNVLDGAGKKKDMAAASADHYHKVSVPAAIKPKAAGKTMKIMGASSNKKPVQNGTSKPMNGDSSQKDWW